MGDEQGTSGGVFARFYGGLRDGDALKVSQPRVVDFKGKERGSGWEERVLEVFCRNAGVFNAGSASGDEDVFRMDRLMGGGVDLEAAIILCADGGDSAVSADTDILCVGGLGEGIDDSLRIIGGGEHAAIGFSFQFHAMVLEPGDGVTGLPAVKRAHKTAISSWVVGAEFTWIKAAVGDITASTAGNANFSENFWTFLEDDDLFHSGFCGTDGSKESGSSSSDHD